MELRYSLRARSLLAAFLVVLLMTFLYWQSLKSRSASWMFDNRPKLLHEAEWRQPVPAFSQRFSRGVPEAELLQWLDDNRFVDVVGNRAIRTTSGLPCRERIEISWTATNGKIDESRAVVSEAGCL